MKTLITILCVLVVVAGIFVTTRFAGRTSHAQDMYVATSHNDLIATHVAADLAHEVWQEQIQPIQSGHVQPAIAQRQSFSAPNNSGFQNASPSQGSALIPQAVKQTVIQPTKGFSPPQPGQLPPINSTNGRPNSGSFNSGSFATRPALNQGFGQTPQKLREKPPSNQNTFRTPPSLHAKQGNAFNQSQPAARSGVLSSVNHVASRSNLPWPSNAENVKNLVRTNYSLPSEAADSIVAFFAADENQNIETKISKAADSTLVKLVVTTDEKTQRAIASFLNAVYPAQRLADIQKASLPSEPMTDAIEIEANEVEVDKQDPKPEPTKTILRKTIETLDKAVISPPADDNRP